MAKSCGFEQSLGTYHSGIPINPIFRFLLVHIRYLRPSFLSLLVVTQVRGIITGSPPPPSPLGFVPSFSPGENFSTLFPRRLTLDCNFPRHALSAVYPFLLLKIKKLLTTVGLEFMEPALVALRVLPDHRGDELRDKSEGTYLGGGGVTPACTESRLGGKKSHVLRWKGKW